MFAHIFEWNQCGIDMKLKHVDSKEYYFHYNVYILLSFVYLGNSNWAPTACIFNRQRTVDFLSCFIREIVPLERSVGLPIHLSVLWEWIAARKTEPIKRKGKEDNRCGDYSDRLLSGSVDMNCSMGSWLSQRDSQENPSNPRGSNWWRSMANILLAEEDWDHAGCKECQEFCNGFC